ncbi:ABC transporter ATP-binding protein [Methanosarcina sp. 2.H.T.1A.6]|uniref:ABC transporter ATP-binding protein n=1 Tax=unclassified Methanosarcina TaxID=2644672 RepID=UPI000622522E|nr:MULTISPECIES: energy-coupling factor transporter ATPase [unclassified Methanosarcina]KKG13418.1 ABC transporter ATP-binding protein [Methanosarcina sp. 2.H.T.1A.15]KKG15017.1 ABC transporter ATP-binding protein [Methanosarcina sp. 2.H.T.1A.3]KKG20716.1 ABC transporter ATP-binding protein [Methanosarcina sp. 2.H.T.1A.8]KKG22033.1 ABC transporter ATP-binding protein [Methanosarcina sp. 2.H.T.1A.6]
MNPTTDTLSHIRLENLTYSYPYSDFQALSDVNLELKKGEFVLLVGPSGCGKSTLVRCLNRLVPEISGGSFSGRVLLRGKDLKHEKVHKLALEVGMVFQNPETQLFSLTVAEDLAFGPENLGLSSPEVRSRVETALKEVGLERLRDHFIFTLSGGEKQRTAIGGNLAMQPEILVLDEPTSDLDPAGTREVLELLRRLNAEKQTTLILIEHKLDAVFEMADRMLVMDNGRLILDGKPFEILCREEEKLRSLGIHPPQLTEIASLLGLGSETSNVPAYETLLKRLTELLQASEAENQLGSQEWAESEIPASMLQPPESLPHVRVENLCYRHEDGSEAFENLNFEIKHGEFLALLGHNGAGKTTLAGHLIGFCRPACGRVLLNGKDISKYSTAQLSKQVGYLFQNPDSQIFTDSVLEEVRFGLENLGMSEEEIKRLANSALEMMELSAYIKRHPHALSRGQRQRLAVASILALEPDLLVLDEPTTGQDRGHIRNFLDKIRELNRLGKTVILITHDMELAAEYAERVVVMKQGKILLDGPTAEVFSSPEELGAAGLIPPLPARLALDLRKQGIDTPRLLTVSDLKNFLRARCPELPDCRKTEKTAEEIEEITAEEMEEITAEEMEEKVSLF